MVVLVDYRPRQRGRTPFSAPKIAEMADFAAFFTHRRKSQWPANPVAPQAEFFKENNARTAVTNAGIDRTRRR